MDAALKREWKQPQRRRKLIPIVPSQSAGEEWNPTLSRHAKTQRSMDQSTYSSHGRRRKAQRVSASSVYQNRQWQVSASAILVPNLEKTSVPCRNRVRNRVAYSAKSKLQASLRWYYWVMIFAVMTATFLLLGASIVRYNQMSEVNRKIRTADEAIESLQAEYDTLTMQLAPYVETGRIEKMAKQLGMVYPSRLQRGIAKREDSLLLKEESADLLANTSNPPQSGDDVRQEDVAQTR